MAEVKKIEVKKLIVNARRLIGVSKKTNKKYDFLTYEGFDTNNRKVTFKLTKAVTNAPKTEGAYVWRVKPENISKDNTSRFNQYWIRGIESVEDYKGPESKDEYEDLPF